MKTSYFMVLSLFALVVSKGLRFTSRKETSLKVMNSILNSNLWASSITTVFQDCKRFLTSSNFTKVAYYWKTYGFPNLNMKEK